MAPKAKKADAAPQTTSQSNSPRKVVGMPLLVITPTDVSRLIREIEMIDENLMQLSLRKGGTEIKMPKTTQLMDQMITLNKLNPLDAGDRKLLMQFLTAIKAEAPVLHVSFSADPSTVFLEKFMAWLRREIHPVVLITIGLQPNIGAGCIVRSTNKYFDLSLKQNFAKKSDMLRQALTQEPAA